MPMILLQPLLKFVLNLCIAVGVVFTVPCTIFVIICIIRGDIRISITKSSNKNSEEEM